MARLTAPGGTLLVIAAVHGGTGEAQSGPPWPLTRAEVESLSAGGLTPAAVKTTIMLGEPTKRRWRAEFHGRNSARPRAAQRHKNDDRRQNE